MAKKESTPSSSPTNAHDPAPDNVDTTGAGSSGPSSAAPASAASSAPPSNEYFTAGSVVRVVTCHGQTFEGHVVTFDPNSRLLALKLPASCRRSSLMDMTCVNLNFVSNVTVVTEPKDNSEANKAPPALNVHRLNGRAVMNVQKKQRLVKSLKQGITPEGQKTFQAISKTLEEIDWHGENIIVMGKVTVTPPYKPENVKGAANTAVQHVRKIIEKHIEDSKRLLQEAAASSTGTNNSSSASTGGDANSTSPPSGGKPSSANPSASSSSLSLASSGSSSSPTQNSGSNSNTNKKPGGGGGGPKNATNNSSDKSAAATKGSAAGGPKAPPKPMYNN